MPRPPANRRLARALPALVAAGVVAAFAAAPVGAKEGLTATLDAPIAFDSPPGEILLVGATVTAPAEDGEPVPVIGTPVYLRLFGPTGATTRAPAEGTRTPGYYTFHIEVPAGGPRGIEMGIHGSSSDGPVDLPIRLAADPFTFGPIRDGTAQLAAPPAPAAPVAGVSPGVVPAASAPAAMPVAPAPPPATAPEGVPGWVVATLVVVVVVIGAGAILAKGRWRAGGRPGVPGAARGG